MKQKESVMNIATTIHRQINAMDPGAFWAWGTKNVVALEDGLQFKSSGMCGWKGIVQVKYDEGQDLYNVVFGKIRKLEWKVTKTVNGVFVEDLVKTIDAQVK
jgi:hypothetical protein